MTNLKKRLLSEIRSYRREWDELVRKIEERGLTESTVTGKMTIKDIIAHISWYEDQIVKIISSKELTGSDLWDLTQDDRNEHLFQINKARSYLEIKKESAEVFQDLVKQISALQNDELLDPSKYRNMPEDWSPAELVAENTFRHYRQHSLSALAFLRDRKTV